jgi:H+/Cl- antiporter ClcA
VFSISIFLGFVFGLIAALIAFVVTWNELEKHQFERKRLWRESFQAAFFTFLFFLILSLLLGFLITKYAFK